MSVKRQIITMGGGGFSHDSGDLSLDRYILKKVEIDRPSICFLATASGDAEGYRYSFYESFARLDCQATHLSLFQLPAADLESFIYDQDIIYVGGGNTRSMLALWREWGVDSALKKAWRQGILLAGMSAGAICWYEQGVTDSVPGALGSLDGLGFLPGSCCPHFDGEPERRPAYRQLIKEKAILPGYAIDDWVALHYVNDELEEIVSARPESAAYKVSLVDDVVQETRIEPTIILGQTT
jgi:peptidase E